MLVRIDWDAPEFSGKQMMSAGRYGTMSLEKNLSKSDLGIEEFEPTYSYEGDSVAVEEIEQIILSYLENPEPESKELWKYLRTNPAFKSKGLRITQSGHAAVEQALLNLGEAGLKVYERNHGGWLIDY